MADNTQLSAAVGSGDIAVTREVSHGGDTAKLQGVFLMGTSGTEGAYTVAAIDGDAANGIDVDVTRVGGTVAVSNAGLTELAAAIDTEVQCDIVGALPAGTNNIGDVDVLTVPADPFGANADAASASGSISAKLRQIATNGIPVTQSGTWDEVGINDSGNSITVDAPVGTPVFVRLSDGSSAVAPALETGGNLAAAATSLGVMDDWDNAASDGASVSGDVAHDAADAGEPVKLGAKATTALSGITLVADADRTNLFAGVDGVQIVRPTTGLEDIVRGNASNTDGASTQVIAASGSASVKTYLTDVTLTNTSSSMIYVEMKSGTTVMYTCPVPATGGFTKTFNPPLPPNAANEAWNFDASAATTTLYCSAIGFKSKV